MFMGQVRTKPPNLPLLSEASHHHGNLSRHPQQMAGSRGLSLPSLASNLWPCCHLLVQEERGNSKPTEEQTRWLSFLARRRQRPRFAMPGSAAPCPAHCLRNLVCTLGVARLLFRRSAVLHNQVCTIAVAQRLFRSWVAQLYHLWAARQ